YPVGVPYRVSSARGPAAVQRPDKLSVALGPRRSEAEEVEAAALAGVAVAALVFCDV
ncbi:hypothetical protein PCASD_15261, partial [Puccinia coronata f. sp. avenae]